jgi:hypothetical protein
MLVERISAGDIRGMGLPGHDIVLHLGAPPTATFFISVAQANEIIGALQSTMAEIAANPEAEIIDFDDQPPRR